MNAEAVLAAASTINCAHMGTVGRAQAGRLRVAQVDPLTGTLAQRAVLTTEAFGQSVTGCTAPSLQPPQSACTTVTVTAGTAAKLSVAGKPVLLATLVATTAPQSLPLLPVVAGQARLKAV